MRNAIFVMLFLCAACSSDSELPVVPTEEHNALSFSADMNEETVAGAYTRSTTPLENIYQEFQVWTVKYPSDGKPTQRVMDGYKTLYDSQRGWYYDGIEGQWLKFWDSAATSYLFNAVTPVPDLGSTDFTRRVETVFSEEHELTLKGIRGNVSSGNYTNSSHAPDWAVARYERTPVTTDVVPLNFKHVFARVDFKVCSAKPIGSLYLFKVMIAEKIKEGGVEKDNTDVIVNTGDYCTKEGEGGGWTSKSVVTTTDQDPKRFGHYTYTDTKPIGEEPVLLASHVQIPQDFPAGGRTFEITLTDKSEPANTYKGTITLTADNNGTNSWEQNMHYTYTLKINNDGVDAHIILFAVDMDTWKWQPGNSTEEEEHNW